MSAWRSLDIMRDEPVEEPATLPVGPSRAVPGKATAVSIISYSVTGIGMLLAPDMER